MRTESGTEPHWSSNNEAGRHGGGGGATVARPSARGDLVGGQTRHGAGGPVGAQKLVQHGPA